MKVINHSIKGDPIRINRAETPDDLYAFKEFVERNPHMGFDTETTGLDWWNAGNGFHCRLVQFGNAHEAWVLPVELGGSFVSAAKWALDKATRLVAQNSPFDIHVVESDFGIEPLALFKKTFNTKILAHLVDGREAKKGGIGLSLEDLVPAYIDAGVGAKVKKSMTEIAQNLNKQKVVVGYAYRNLEKETEVALFSEFPEMSPEELKAHLKAQKFTYIRERKEGIYGKVNKDNVWKVVPLDHEGYNLYAGMDPIFAYRLLLALWPKIPKRSLQMGLVGWEHRLSWVTYQMERTGYLVDEEYTKARIEELLKEEEEWKAVAAEYGVDLIGSSEQIITALTKLGFGHKLTKRTKPTEKHPEGQISTDDSVLSSIDHPLTGAIIKAKSAQKKRKTWFENALNNRDKDGRVHPATNALQARSGRMTVTGAIAAQTLPAGTGYVRNAFLAEEGHVTATADFSSMELMFLAADSGDPTMLRAYKEEKDLHNITAATAFGAMGWDSSQRDEKGKEAYHPKRKAGKGTNYTVCFGGGKKAVHEQWGISLEDAAKAVKAFWEAYPKTGKLSEKCTNEANRHGFIYTVTGRRILTDEARPYAGMNYRIQSSCRDITARAVIELDKAGFTPYMRLIIHDEVVFSFPKERAEEMAAQAAKIMAFTYKGLTIPADYEVGDRSWGSVLEKENSKH